MDYRLITAVWEKEQFIESWEAAFGQKLPREMARWLFLHPENIMYGVFDGRQLAAGYCLLNQRMLVHGRVQKGALCNNVFVHPDYQGQKLFTLLGQFALKEAAAQGITMAIGIPNKNAVPGHKKVGWTFLNEINFLEKKILARSKGRLPEKVCPLTKENYPQYRKKLEELSYRLAEKRSFSVIKDQAFFQWRYLEKPLVDYKILMYLEEDEPQGYVVYKYYAPMARLHIVDLEASNKTVFNSLLEVADTLEAPFELINVWGSSIDRDKFLEKGFTESKEINHLIAIQPQTREDVDLGGAIHIVLGDNEVF